jgi:hypothetical protein
MDFSNTLFRASGIGHLMAEPKSAADKKAGNLSEGAKTHLIDVYVQNKYGRKTDISNKYIEKGLQVEEDAITLFSRVKKRFFKKNELHMHNQYLKGTPDLFEGLEISIAEEIIDIKSSWDIYTFFRVHTKDINSLYWYQLQAYMALTGAKKATLAYCLVNTPELMLMDEKRRLFYKMNAGTEENADYIKAAEELEKSMIYDDIPLNERVIEFNIERDDAEIENMYAKITKARKYLNELDRKLSPSVLLAEFDSSVKATIISND